MWVSQSYIALSSSYTINNLAIKLKIQLLTELKMHRTFSHKAAKVVNRAAKRTANSQSSKSSHLTK